MEQISVTELISKFPTLEDQRLFLKESGKAFFYLFFIGFYFPSFKGFDTKFFISFIRGEKKVSLNLFIGNFCLAFKNRASRGTNIPFFTKSNHFTRSHLLSYFNNIPELKEYLPDDIKEQSLVRDYLLNV